MNSSSVMSSGKLEMAENSKRDKNQLYIVYLHVTQECNLRCTYCYAKHNLGKNMKMEHKDAKKYVDILYSEGVRIFNITGGEPLLNEDSLEIIKYIKSYKDTSVWLLTNGTLLSDNIEVLKMCDSIVMSLDVNGAPNRKGMNYDKLIKDIDNLDDVLKKKITIRSVISKGEEEYIAPMMDMVDKWGMKYIFVPRLPNGPEEVAEMPNMKTAEFEEVCDEVFDMLKCGATRSELAVDWNGDVYPCQNMMKAEQNITNLNNANWKEIFESSEITREIRNARVNSIEKCNTCGYKYICGGGCRALSYNVYGEYNHCLDFLCESFMNIAIRKLNGDI